MKRILGPVFRMLDKVGLGAQARPQTPDSRLEQLHRLLARQRHEELDRQFSRLPPELQYPALLSLAQAGKAVDSWALLAPSLTSLMVQSCALLLEAATLSSELEKHTLLQEADDYLQRAHTLAPYDPLPFCAGLAVGSALGLDIATLEERFAALRQRAPKHYWGQVMMLDAYAAIRDNEAMLAFARKMQRRSSRGDGTNIMPVLAHLRIAARFGCVEDRENYCHTPEVKEEIQRVYLRSLASSSYVMSAATGHQRNHMAVALFLCGARRQALRELRRLQGYDSEAWQLLTRTWRESQNPGLVIDRLYRAMITKQARDARVKLRKAHTILQPQLHTRSSQVPQTVPG